MATLSLYTDKYGGTVEKFELAQLDTSGKWGGLSTDDYEIYAYMNYDNTTTGEKGMMISILVNLSGIPYISNIPENSILNPPEYKIGTYMQDDGTEIPHFYCDMEQVKEQPENWSDTWWNYIREGVKTYSQKLYTYAIPFWSGGYYTKPPEFNESNTYKFKQAGYTISRPFWTFGSNSFMTCSYLDIDQHHANTFSSIYNDWLAGVSGIDSYYYSIHSGTWSNGGFHFGTLYNDKGLRFSNHAFVNNVSVKANVLPLESSPLKKLGFVAFTIPKGTKFSNSFTSDKDYNFVGTLSLQTTPDNIVQSAKIIGLTLDYWQTPGQKGNWGPQTGIEGGNGVFKAPSDNYGDKEGNKTKEKANNANNAIGSSGIFSSEGLHLHRLAPNALNIISTKLVTSDYIERFARGYYNPMSAVIRCYLLPSYIGAGLDSGATINSSGSTGTITLSGYKFEGAEGELITSPIKDIHIGSVDFNEVYNGNFADFEPYTKMTLHLPFTGDIPISPELCQGGWLSIDALFDATTGNINYLVTTSDRAGKTFETYRATGNCAYDLPLSQNASSSIGSALQSMGNLFTSPSIGSAISFMNETVFPGYGISTKGTMGGSFSLLGDDVIYLFVQRKVGNNPTDFDELAGIPSNIGGTINGNSVDFASFSGFLKCAYADVGAIVGATEDEIREIEGLLKEGIFI